MKPASIWRNEPQRYRLEAGKCLNCGELHMPKRLVCDACGKREFETVKLTPKGKVITYTVVHVAPEAFRDQSPYPVAIIELDEGLRMLCQMADVAPEEVRTGMRVRLETRKIRSDGEAGVIAYGPKAVPE